MEIMLLGHLGRDAAVADRLVQEGHRLHVVGAWANPGLMEAASRSGGEYHFISQMAGTPQVLGEITDIASSVKPDMFFTHHPKSAHEFAI